MQSKPLPDTGGQRTGRRDGSALAGHLGEAHVRPTLAVTLTESRHTCASVRPPNRDWR